MSTINISSTGHNQIVRFLKEQNKDSIKKPSSNDEKQTKQASSDALTPEVLKSMHFFIVEDDFKSFVSMEHIRDNLFGNKSFLKLASDFLSDASSEDEKELIIARFAMKFLFPDKVQTPDEKMQNIIEILKQNLELQQAVRTVLSSAVADDPDGDKIIKSFDKVISPDSFEKEAVETETQYTTLKKKNIKKMVTFSEAAEAVVAETGKNVEEVTNATNKVNQELSDLDSSNLSPEKKAKLLAEILERIEEFKKLGNKFELGMKEFEKIVLEALSLNIFSDDEKEGLKELMQVLDIYGVSVVVFGIELMGAIKNIDLEKGELELDENNDYFIMAKNWLTTQKGLEEDDAINKIYEFMFYSMLAKDLYEKSIKMKEINSQMEFLMHSIDQKIQLIEMRIEILRLKESDQEPDDYSEGIENKLISILRSLDNMVSEREEQQTSAMAFSAEKEAINKMILELKLDETFKEQLNKVLEEINSLAENTNYNFNVQLVVEQLRI